MEQGNNKPSNQRRFNKKPWLEKKKKMLVNKIREIDAHSRMIRIKNLGPQIELHEYGKFFSGFGEVEYVRHSTKDPNTIEVQFSRAEFANTALRVGNSLLYKGNKIIVLNQKQSPHQNNRIVQEKHAPGPSAKPLVTKKKNKYLRKFAILQNDTNEESKLPSFSDLDLSGGFDEQISTLVSGIRLKPFNVFSMAAVCADITNALQSYFPRCEVIPFGSITNGLALVGSDMDCFGKLTEENMMRISNNAYSNNHMRKIVDMAKKALQSYSNLFTKILVIYAKRVPLVKFVHIPSKTPIDLNFNNSMGIANSNLIRFLLSTDNRLVPLFVFLKYWGKINHIIGQNKFSSYSFTLLIIFFLQRLPKPILPPIHTLQASALFDHFINEWNCGFNNTPCNFPQTENDSNILTLIEEFYDFYAYFPFDQLVICPLKGLPIEFRFFTEITSLPPELELYIRYLQNTAIRPFYINKYVSVQDPFELNRNVTAGAFSKLVELFQNRCKSALEKINESKICNLQPGVVNKLLGLESQLKSFVITVPMGPRWKKMHGKDRSIQGTKRAREVILSMLKDVLMCTFTSVELDKTQGREKYPLTAYICKPVYNLWTLRKDFYTDVVGLSVLEKEKLATKHLYDTLYKNQIPKQPLFEFHMKVFADSWKNHFQLEIASGPLVDIFEGLVDLVSVIFSEETLNDV